MAVEELAGVDADSGLLLLLSEGLGGRGMNLPLPILKVVM